MNFSDSGKVYEVANRLIIEFQRLDHHRSMRKYDHPRIYRDQLKHCRELLLSSAYQLRNIANPPPANSHDRR